MKNSTIPRTIWFAGFALVASLSFVSGAERVALVIGNGAYKHGRQLANPVRDAAAVEALLKKAGFEVVGVRDAGLEAMYEGLENFKTAAASARVGLVYFAGHGIEIGGKNYLLPVDAALETAAQLHTQTLPLQRVLLDMREIRLPAKMVILDCCRDNPLTRSWMTNRGATPKGLRAVSEENLPEATLIMYAAAPGKVALDGSGDNSPFTSALVRHLGRPGVSAFDAFLGVSDSVAKSTGNRQVPWIKFDGAGRVFRLFTLVGAGEPKPASGDSEPLTATTPPKASSDSPPSLLTNPGHPPETGSKLPTRGYFNNSEVFSESPYAGYNRYSRDQILRKVQESLFKEGLYKSSVDGVMGPGTQSALIAWQETQELTVTGTLDTLTLGKLGFSGIKESEPPKPKVEGATIPTRTAPTGKTLNGKWRPDSAPGVVMVIDLANGIVTYPGWSNGIWKVVSQNSAKTRIEVKGGKLLSFPFSLELNPDGDSARSRGFLNDATLRRLK